MGAATKRKGKRLEIVAGRMDAANGEVYLSLSGGK